MPLTTAAPGLSPTTWYGMPAYTDADGKVVVDVQGASTFGTRSCTLRCNDSARLDDGTVWPTSSAITRSPDADVELVEQLVRRAVA